MPAAENPYRQLFLNWPDSLAKRGIIVSTLNETMPFKGFMVRKEMLLLERQNPDSLGARFILMQYEDIAAVKLVDPLKTETFLPLGFVGKMSQ